MPRLSPGVELLGQYRDSGLENPPYLVRREGRILQVSRLLYAVAAAADGVRTCGEMAVAASLELDRPLTGEQVRSLVREKLAPSGILTTSDTPSVPAPPAVAAAAADKRLLSLRFRRAVVSAEQLNVWAGRVAGLFRPAVVLGVLGGVVAFDLWLFGVHGVARIVERVVQDPAAMALVMALVAISGAFHELGHAAGCRFSGGRPGAAGVGLYLCWPVLYANVTDVYRLDRTGRLRTDLGGIYFNAVFTMAVAAVYLVTGFEALLAVVVAEHVLVLHQLIPFVRLDGYYVVSDLTGVPDILTRVGPALRSLVPGRPTHPAVAALRPHARRLLFTYLAGLFLFLVLVIVPAVLLIPRTLGANWDSLLPHFRAIREAASEWDAPAIFGRAMATTVLALPTVGLLLILGTLARRFVRGVARSTGRILPRPRGSSESVQGWLESSGLAIVDGADIPGGGAVDFIGFGVDGDLVLFAAAIDRQRSEVVAGLQAAAAALRSFSSDSLDRLLLDGPPFVEAVATVARRRGHAWDEQEFRSRLDDTLGRGDIALVVLQPVRRGGGRLEAVPVPSAKSSQN